MSSEENEKVDVSSSSLSLKPDFGKSRFNFRPYPSSNHLWAAKHFKDLAVEIEQSSSDKSYITQQKHVAYVTSAILTAVAFLEVAVNEFTQDVVDAVDKESKGVVENQETYIKPIDKASRKRIWEMWQCTEEKRKFISTLNKCQEVLKFCGKQKFNQGAPTYQDAKLVIELRNTITHYKPQTYGVNEEGEDVQHELFKKLKSKFPENPFMANFANPYFPDKCLGSHCAAWAVFSVKNLADEFFQKLGITPQYKR